MKLELFRIAQKQHDRFELFRISHEARSGKHITFQYLEKKNGYKYISVTSERGNNGIQKLRNSQHFELHKAHNRSLKL